MDKCESCVFYLYDEEYDDYVCDMDLDEDEMARFLASGTTISPRGSSNIQQKRGDSTSAVSPLSSVPHAGPPAGCRALCAASRVKAARPQRRPARHIPAKRKRRGQRPRLFSSPMGKTPLVITPQQAEQQKKRYLPDFFRRRRPAAPLRLSTAAAA